MRVAIFGAGRWGANHVRVFSHLLGESCVTVCDPDPKRLASIRASHPSIETYDRPRTDGASAVVIATPAPSHHTLARQALEEGCDVLVEKPLALTTGDAANLVTLAESRGRILMVDHLLEYHPSVVALRELLHHGALGPVLHLRSQRLNLGVIRDEENAWWSLAPHDLSMILDLLDAEPVHVSAVGAAYLRAGIADVVYASAMFSSGALAHIEVSWLDAMKTRRLVVVCERGTAVFDDAADSPLTVYRSRAAWVGTRFVAQRGPVEVIPVERAEPLTRVAEAFVESIATRRPPRSDGEDGLRVVRCLEAGQLSMERSGAAVAPQQGGR